jgi:hypothetical protein
MNEQVLNLTTLSPGVASNIVSNIRYDLRSRVSCGYLTPNEIYSDEKCILAWYYTYHITREKDESDYDLIYQALDGTLIIEEMNNFIKTYNIK